MHRAITNQQGTQFNRKVSKNTKRKLTYKGRELSKKDNVRFSVSPVKNYKSK